jgi:hypothetical protein
VELVNQERFAAVVSEVRQLVALTVRHESGPGVGQQPQQASLDERRIEVRSWGNSSRIASTVFLSTL